MRAWVLAASLALASCASADHMAVKEDAKCRSYGAEPGTPIYVACRMKLEEERVTLSKVLLSSGESMQQSSGYVPRVPGPPPVPGSGGNTVTRLGGSPIAMCMKTGESLGQGYKVCRYNCGGSAAVLNVGFAELCPISPN